MGNMKNIMVMEIRLFMVITKGKSGGRKEGWFMFEKFKGKITEIKEENQRKREEQENIAKERAEEEARIEHERIQTEKNALMALSEKELMVEAIMVLRGYNTRLTIIEKNQNDLDYRIGTLESDVSSLESEVLSIKSSDEY